MCNIRILMVCLGNICRSPLAEGILRNKIKDKATNIIIDSAGIEPYHIGEAPDPRAIKIAKKYGIDISQLRARQFSVRDFEAFDRIYVMDSIVFDYVKSLAGNEADKKKVISYLEEAGYKDNIEVPDPWYGGMSDFDYVFHLLDDASEKIAHNLLKEEPSLKGK